MPEMIPVASSLIKTIGFDDEKEELHVEFTKGGEYLYYKVPRPIFDAMMETLSVGSFFLRNIKGQYEFLKVA